MIKRSDLGVIFFLVILVVIISVLVHDNITGFSVLDENSTIDNSSNESVNLINEDSNLSLPENISSAETNQEKESNVQEINMPELVLNNSSMPKQEIIKDYLIVS